MQQVERALDLSKKDCEALSQFLARYEGGSLNYATLKMMMIILAIIACVHIMLVFTCKACSTISWCGFVIVAQLIISVTFVALYIAIFIHIDRLSLNYFARDKDQLVKVLADCATNHPYLQLQINPATRYNFGSDKSNWIGYVIVLASCVSIATGLYDSFRLCDSNRSDMPVAAMPLSRFQKDTLVQMQVTEQQRAQISHSEICPICLDEMTSGALSMLACDHVFHEACLAKWMATARKPSCPMCKACIAPSAKPCNVTENICSSIHQQVAVVDIV